jgi:hypothetical protein
LEQGFRRGSKLIPLAPLVAEEAESVTLCAVRNEPNSKCQIAKIPPETATHVIDSTADTTLTLPGIQRTIPAGTFPQGTLMILQPVNSDTSTGSLVAAGPDFNLNVLDSETGLLLPSPYAGSYTLTLTPDEQALLSKGLRLSQLGIYSRPDGSLDPSSWQSNPSLLDSSNQTYSAQLNHMTEFALLADVTAPATTAVLTGAVAPNNAHLTPVTVALDALDPVPGSGLAASYYQLVPHGSAAPSNTLPGAWQVYAGQFAVPASSDLDLYAFSVDHATNAELPVLLGQIATLPSVTITGAPTSSITFGTPITLTANVTQGASPFTYAWTKNGAPFGTTASITDTPAADATYAVTLTDSFAFQSNTAQVSVSVTSGSGGPGGCDSLTCPPPPGATPELDSLLLFGSGMAGLASYACIRLRGRRRRS